MRDKTKKEEKYIKKSTIRYLDNEKRWVAVYSGKFLQATSLISHGYRGINLTKHYHMATTFETKEEAQSLLGGFLHLYKGVCAENYCLVRKEEL